MLSGAERGEPGRPVWNPSVKPRVGTSDETIADIDRSGRRRIMNWEKPWRAVTYIEVVDQCGPRWPGCRMFVVLRLKDGRSIEAANARYMVTCWWLLR